MTYTNRFTGSSSSHSV